MDIKTKLVKVKKIISKILIFSLIFHPVVPVWAQTTPELPQTDAILTLSVPFTPIQLQGLIFDFEQPLNFDFVVTKGDVPYDAESFKAESEKLIKYFMAAMTIPEEDMWVNLSVYEHDRIIPEAFGQTAMGRDLLAQDYLLKQLTSSLIHPETESGESFWEEVHQLGSDESADDAVRGSFHKVWIIPDQVTVAKQDNGAFIYQSHLKVMLKSDFIAMQKTKGATLIESESGDDMKTNEAQNEIIRRRIIPLIEKEVNSGSHFAPLRQIYNAVILAAYYRSHLYETIVGRAYVDNKKIDGIQIKDVEDKEKIYEQYLESYRKGVFNFVKEDYDPHTQRIIPRKYFSGGAILGEMHVDEDAPTGSNFYQKNVSGEDGPIVNDQKSSKLSKRISVIEDQRVSLQTVSRIAKAGAYIVRSVFQLVPAGTSKGLDALQRYRERKRLVRQNESVQISGALGVQRGDFGFLRRYLQETRFRLPSISLEKSRAYVRPALYGYILAGLIFLGYYGVTQMSHMNWDIRISSILKNNPVKVLKVTEDQEKIQLPQGDMVVTIETATDDNKKSQLKNPARIEEINTYSPPDKFQTIKNIYRVLQVTDPYKTEAEIEAIVNIMVKIIFAESNNLAFTEQLGDGPAKGYAQILPWVALDMLRQYRGVIFDYIEILDVNFSAHQIHRIEQIFDYYDREVQNLEYEERKSYFERKAKSLEIDKMFKDNDILMVLLQRLYLDDRLKDEYLDTQLEDIAIGNLWKKHYNTHLGKGYSGKVVKHAEDAELYLEAAKNQESVELERIKTARLGLDQLKFAPDSDYLPSITRQVIRLAEIQRKVQGDVRGQIQSRILTSLKDIEKEIIRKKWRRRDWTLDKIKFGDILNHPDTNESLIILKAGKQFEYISSKTGKIEKESFEVLKTQGYKRINSQLPLLRISEIPGDELFLSPKNQDHPVEMKSEEDAALATDAVGGILLDAQYMKMNVLDEGQRSVFERVDEAYYVDINDFSGFVPRILEIIPFQQNN